MATKQFQNAKLKVDHLDLSSDTARSALQSGENISHSLGKIARWYKDIVWADTKATIDAYGIVKLSDDYKSTSTDTVPTSKTLNDVVQLIKQTGGWNTTYDFNSNIDSDENLQNGQFKVTEHDIEGDIDHYVTIKGLGSAAFTDSDKYATAGHTHLYAGSSTAGGVANSAAKLSDIPAGGIGSETKPVYFSGTTGRPVACTYSLNASVPSGAIFTDEKVKQSPVTTDGSFEVLFAGSTGNTEKTEGVGKTTTLVFNPSSGTLTATSFTGSGSGLTSLNASNISSGTLAVARLADSGVVAGTYGPAANASLAHSGTFDVPDFTVDAKGRVTGAHTRTFTLPDQYVHPTHTSKTSGLYKITVDSLGHVSATAAVAKTDIPALDYVSSTTTRNPNVVLAGPASGTTAAAPTFRSLVVADLPASGATAGSYGPSANATPGYGATFNVPYITIDAKGRVTSISNKTVKIPASDNTNTTYTLSGAYGSGSNTWVTTLTPSSGSATTSTVPVGTTSAYGLMKLYNGVDSTSTALAATANAVKTAYDKANHSHPYLPTAGGTMTGKITCMSDQYTDNYTTGCIDCKNSNIVGINSLVFADLADSSGEGLQFYRTSTTVDTIWVKNGVIYFTPNRTLGSSGTDYTVIHSNNYSSYALPTTTKYASSSSVGGPAYSVEGTSGTDESFRHVWFSVSNTETRRAYSDKFMFEPANGILKFNSWYPYDITGITVDLNGYHDGSGKYGYRRYICKTIGGGSNISNKPCDSPFVLEVFLIRFATASTDYITKQVYHAFNKKTYQRFCTNGTWDSWTEMKYTDTNTDTKVTQTATTTSASYEVLFSGTADNTTRTEGARKNSNLTFNPSIGTLRVTSTSFGTIEVYRNNGSNGAAIRFYNNVTSNAITELGSIGMNAKNGSLLRWTAGASSSYAICDENNTTFTASLTSGTKIGTIKIAGTSTDLYCQTNTDTKNTAGSTNTSSKIFLIGATSQAANPQTYSHDTAYVGTDGCLYSNSTKVSVEGHAHGLGHSDFIVFINETTNTWAAIGVEGRKFVLKSIRTDVSAPPYLLGGYSAGIVFGGADTRGVISVAYSNPTIRFAGGSNTTTDGGTATWYITLTGTHNTSYDLNTINYVKQSSTTTSNYRGVLLGYTTTANTTDTRETTVTNQSYITNKIFACPSAGSLYATNLYAYVIGTADVYVSLFRSGNSSWRFINTQGALKLQNNYYSSAVQSWYTVAEFGHSGGGYITIKTPPTHTSSNRYINYQYNGIAMKVCSKASWSMGIWWHKNDGSATLGSFGAYGAANALSYYYWGPAYDSTQLRLYPTSGGGLVTQQANGFRLAFGGYGVIFRNDGGSFYILLTDKKTDGSELTGDNWNSKRPLTISLSSGICNINGNAATATTWATARTLTIGSTGKSVNGSANVSWSLSEIGAAASDHGHWWIDNECSANRFAFLKPAGVTIEHSKNSGSSWTTASYSNEEKIRLFTSSQTIPIGGYTSSEYATSAYQTRITVDASAADIYTYIRAFSIKITTSGSTGCTVTIQMCAVGSTTYNTIIDGLSIYGWPGRNFKYFGGFTFGKESGQIRYIRFIFKITGGATSGSFRGLQILSIRGYGGEGWNEPSYMASTGHLYSYDAGQNAIFPAKVTASSFSGAINGVSYNEYDPTSTSTNVHRLLFYQSNTATTSGSVGSDLYCTYDTIQGVLKAPAFQSGVTKVSSLYMTGNISYTGTKATHAMIKFVDNTANADGNGIIVGGAGLTVVGSGESGSALVSALSLTGGTEQLYLTSDNSITFYTNCNTIANRKGVSLDTSLNFYPIANGIGSVGHASYKWNTMYANTFYGALSGNASTATKWATARTLTIGSKGKSVDGSGNVSWTLAEIGAASSASSSIAWSTETISSLPSSNYPNYTASGSIYYRKTDGWVEVYVDITISTTSSTTASVNIDLMVLGTDYRPPKADIYLAIPHTSIQGRIMVKTGGYISIMVGKGTTGSVNAYCNFRK